jgi:hypothetical protein
MSNIDEDIELLLKDIPSPVPPAFLESLTCGSLNPKTGKEEQGYGYDEREKGLLLSLAREEKDAILGLESWFPPVWISSGGGPGSGKSTALFQLVAGICDIDIPEKDWLEPSLKMAMDKIFPAIPMALVSPDRRGLLSLVLRERGEATSDLAFYLEWRWGSNFLSNVALNSAVAYRKNIVHDTTLSSPKAVENLGVAKAIGYYIVVVMHGSPRETRDAAADNRNKTFFQSLPANVIEQDALFAEKIPEIVKTSDRVVVSWRDGANENAWAVAKISDNRDLCVIDPEGFEKYCSAYPQMRKVAGELKIIEAADMKPDWPVFRNKVLFPAAPEGLIL